MQRMLVATLVALLAAVALQAQAGLGAAITYQGRLTDAGAPAIGSYDLQFTVYDAVTGGAALGSTVTANGVTVTAGVFTVTLDFGAGVFAGSARWLEVRVRPGGTSGPFTTLSPRQALMPAPQSLYAISSASATTAGSALTAATATTATTATSASQLAGQPPSFYLNLANLTGTLSVAKGGTGATSLAGLQARVTGTCQPGAVLRGINADGTVTCGTEAAQPSVGLFQPAPLSAEHTSITIGTDGLPLISYYDPASFDLRVAHCANAGCTGLSAPPAPLDSAGTVGLYPSIAIGDDGLGLISYYDQSNGALKVAHCANTACTVLSAPAATLDSADVVGLRSSLAIGADGLGLITYADSTNGDLKVAHCANVACSGVSATPSTVDTGGTVGGFSALTIGADGLGLIAYYDATNGDLKVSHCTNAPCSTYTLPISIDSAGTVGQYPSIAIGADGLGLISYYDVTNTALKVAHCANVNCSSLSMPPVTLDNTGAVGTHGSITIGADGFGLISYVSSSGDLKVAHCDNSACTTATLAVVHSGAGAQFTSITIGADGRPLISYSPPGTLRLAHCGNALCSPFVTRRR